MATEDNQKITWERKCHDCGEPIHICMGFVHTGDWLEGKKPVRELCGKCVLLRNRTDTPEFY